MRDKPIKIMAVIARLNIGGPAVVVSLLAERFAAPDYQTLLVCGSIDDAEGDMSYYAEQHGVQPHIVPELGRSLHPIRDLITIWKLYRLMRQYQPDVVHTHTAKAGFVGRWAAWLARVPVIVHTFHGHVFSGYFSPAKTRFFILLEQLTARISTTVMTLTPGLQHELAERYHITSAERVTVLPLGLDLTAFANAPRKSGIFRQVWNIPPDSPLIGIIGRFVAVKNHALFIEAAALIKQAHPNAYFILIGDGELRPDIEAQVAALGLRECVTFTGWQRELTAAYADLDVFVMTSLNEGTPVTVIEALAAGCPVVSTAVGGVPDLLQNGALGRLVPSGDAQALADAVLDTLASPPDHQHSRQFMLQRYGIDRLVRDLDALYRALLNN